MKLEHLQAKTAQFFESKTIVLIGISSGKGHEASVANYRKLKEAGYKTYFVNPFREEFEGQVCYSRVEDIDSPIDAALIFTSPKVTPTVARECYEAGIRNIWIHHGMGGSKSSEASRFLQNKEDVNFIDGACPLMFIPNGDWFHKGFKNILGWMNKLPA